MENEKSKLEQELKESEARYRDLFENADDPMYTHDLEGRLLSVNKAGLKILGGPEDEIIGSNISKWLTPESYRLFQERVKKIHAGLPLEEPVVIEVICRNGEHRWGEVRTRLMMDGDRMVVHGIARDITEKKKLELKLIEYHEMLRKSYDELKEAEMRYRDLFENAEDPIYTLDTGGNFQTINKAGLRILGCTMEEVAGTHISKWLTPESFSIAQEVLKKQSRGEHMESPVILEVVCKNGEHRWGEIKTRFTREGDRITGIHGIARDVTEKRKMEQKINEYHEKLKRSFEELIEADRLKTEFISNITHELLTPLTSIKGFTELLYDETNGRINSEQKKSLEIILRNSDRLIRLIRDLLDVAYLDKNRLGLQFGLVSMEDIISKCVQDTLPQVNEKDLTIVRDIAPLPRIWGDEERLTQVVANLLGNAIKFTPEKGMIAINASENAGEIKISVKDTGIGIPKDRLSRIFDRFYQLDGSARRKYGGIGIGLSICKSIVEAHYGSIWADSDGSSGSTFHILLPKLADSKKKGQ